VEVGVAPVVILVPGEVVITVLLPVDVIFVLPEVPPAADIVGFCAFTN
jgi:hypothetical protein